jgi:SAM-dependent methyltransferase
MQVSGPLLRSTAGYGDEADALAVQYESITFAQAHRQTLYLFPTDPCRVLDIGAGTGRDAAALSARGHVVTAVEPTPELRAHGERIHAGSGIRWIDDMLPELRVVAALGEIYDLVLMTAVWMHLDADERIAAFRGLRGLLSPAGRIIMSLRHGPVPEGRRMFDVTGDETISLAHDQGFEATFRCEQADMLGRADVSWTFLALQPR